MAKDGKLHAEGDLKRRVLQWWEKHCFGSAPKDITVCGDGGVNVRWADGEESGTYFISGALLYAETEPTP